MHHTSHRGLINLVVGRSIRQNNIKACQHFISFIWLTIIYLTDNYYLTQQRCIFWLQVWVYCIMAYSTQYKRLHASYCVILVNKEQSCIIKDDEKYWIEMRFFLWQTTSPYLRSNIFIEICQWLIEQRANICFGCIRINNAMVATVYHLKLPAKCHFKSIFFPKDSRNMFKT